MDFDQIIVKESPGLCRCCLSEGCYKDLGSEYTWMCETEIYADMLLECFDISISQHNEGPNGANRLICEVCITRLRDACNFKKQVMDSEKKFVDMVGRGEFQPKVMIYQTPMKTESLVEESMANDGDVEYLDEELDFGDDLPLNDSEDISDDMPISTLKARGKRGRPKKTATAVKAEKKAKVPKLDDKPRTSKAVAKGRNRRIMQQPSRKNLQILFHNTTVIPFRWRSVFQCFYCACFIPEGLDLIEHVRTKHKDSTEEEEFNKFKPRLLLTEKKMMVDMSIVKCKLCLSDFKTLDVLISHLIHIHQLGYDRNNQMYYEQFKLTDSSCAECGKQFLYFSFLADHVAEHYPIGHDFDNDEDSADSSENEDRMQTPVPLENSAELKQGHVSMEIPEITESHQMMPKKELNKLKYRNIEIFHNMTTAVPFRFNGKLKCFYCNEQFSNYDLFMAHMPAHAFNETNASLPPNFKKAHLYTVKFDLGSLACRVCQESFEDFNDIIEHLNNKHNAKYDKTITEDVLLFKLESITCVLCNSRFGTLRALVKHSNMYHILEAKKPPYFCMRCSNEYKFEKSLKRHELQHDYEDYLQQKELQSSCILPDVIVENHQSNIVSVIKQDTDERVVSHFGQHYEPNIDPFMLGQETHKKKVSDIDDRFKPILLPVKLEPDTDERQVSDIDERCDPNIHSIKLEPGTGESQVNDIDERFDPNIDSIKLEMDTDERQAHDIDERCEPIFEPVTSDHDIDERHIGDIDHRIEPMFVSHTFEHVEGQVNDIDERCDPNIVSVKLEHDPDEPPGYLRERKYE